MEFHNEDEFLNKVNTFAAEKGVKYKPKFIPISNEYYLFCIHHGTETNISTKCEAKIYAKFKQDKGLVVTNIKTEHKGHLRYSQDELSQMVKLREIPEEVKESAKDLFLKGWNLSEILPILMTKHKSSE